MIDLVDTPIGEFAAADDPGAEPLASSTSDGGVVIPAEGLVLVYGDGGAGKTTLIVDACIAFASAASWLGVVTVARPLRILMIENDGPRQEFRKKLERKLHHHAVNLDDQIRILEDPWAEFTFAEGAHREALAALIAAREYDLVVVGPLASVGAIGGGTPDQIEDFKNLLEQVRRSCKRKFAALLIHHENRAGQISGAWERLPDTLIHVQGQGHGRTRLLWQKVRWASALHGTALQLAWADGESFTVEAKPDVTDDTMTDDLLEAVRANPGASWTKLRDLEAVRGKATDLAKLRDRLINDGTLVNSSARDGYFNLWHRDDPAAPRSHPGTAWERLTDAPPAGTSEASRSPVPYVSRNGVGNGTALDVPEVDFDEHERPPTNDHEDDLVFADLLDRGAV